jgi:hypothetical protein
MTIHRVVLGKTTLDSISLKLLPLLLFGQFETRIWLVHSQVKKHGNVLFRSRCFKSLFLPTPHSKVYLQYLLHQLACHLFWIELNWNSIQVNLNKSQFNWFSIQVQFKFNSSFMQCHSIFSFKCNLIFTKSIHFFHQFINYHH